MLQLREYRDPLPALLPLPKDIQEDGLLLVTTSARPVDEELRAIGYQVEWKPVRLDDGTGANCYKATPWPKEGRKPAKVMVGRLPYGNQEVPDVADWLINLVDEFHTDNRIEDFRIARIDDTPTSMCRNRLAKIALEWGADLLVFIDADMRPDYLVGHPDEPHAKTFWKSAFDYWWQHRGPCLIGAPYCCGGSNEDPLIFKWQTPRSPHEEGTYKIARYSRDESIAMRGISRVSALPTGMLMVDCEVFRRMPRPWFYYEYTDDTYSEKASTEDVTFTRDASLHCIPLYCTWDSWAGHWKRKLVGRPHHTSPLSIPPLFRNACLRTIDESFPGMTVVASV